MSIISGVGAGLGGAGDSGGALGSFYSHTINQSLKLDDGSGGHLTISSASPTATNRKKVTISCWVKRSTIGTEVNTVFWASTAGLMLQFFADNTIYIYDNNAGGWQSTVTNGGRLFRDIGSWYHLALIIDTTQSTEADRAKFYINGELQTLNSYPGSNTDITWHTGSTMKIGNPNDSTDLAGYIAEFISIDGQDVSISDLGETKDGVWIPKNVSGLTLGDAGFYLKFDNSSDIGNDSGSNNIDFTASNLVAADVMPDSPTNNFATFNSLLYHGNTYSEGNLKNSSPTTDYEIQVATMFPAGISGKWYAEFYVHTCNASSTRVGVGVTDPNVDPEDYLGNESPDVAYYDINDIYTGGSKTADTDATFAAGDIISVALNLDDGEVTFRKNNSTMSNGTQNLVASTLYTFATSNYGSGAGVVANFGQDDTFAGNKTSGSAAASDGNGIGDFYYAPPSDFLALCASNLPDPTIGPGQDTLATDLFNTILWTGDGNTSRAITGVGFAPDLMWLKSRSHTEDHALEDTVRGVGKKLDSSGTETEETTATAVLSAHGSDGFTLPASTPGNLNVNTRTYVAWNWKAGGKADTFNINGTGYSSASDASLSGGDITPTGASINTAAGFGIIAYTGDGTSGARTVKHGLSSPPELIFIKDRDANSNNGQWQASSSVVGDDYGYLSTTAAFTGAALMKPTAGDATTIQLGLGITATTNESGDDFIMYLFHSVEGFSKVGTYDGNQQNYDDGTYIYTGFRPALVVVKTAVTTTSNWVVTDNKRASAFNGNTTRLYWNTNGSETAYNSNRNVELFSNGFTVHGNNASDNANRINQPTSYLFYAVAEAPFKFANAR